MGLEKRLIELTLPEADIDGLYFNEQKVRAIFDKQDDGWWQSKVILFQSARNVENDNSRDILTEYLNDFRIRAQIAATFNVSAEAVTVELPRENKGIKKYHGVGGWYWLADFYSISTANFCYVTRYGRYGGEDVCIASAVGGCAPAFRINEQYGKAGVEKGYSHHDENWKSWETDWGTFLDDMMDDIGAKDQKELIGEEYFECDWTPVDTRKLVRIDWVLDSINENATDKMGEIALDYPTLTDKDKEELKTLIAAFLDNKGCGKYVEPEKIVKKTITLEDLEAAP